jgi:hypothetical protein
MNPSEALDFFALKVEHQSILNGAPLSDIEKKMLRWSEIEPGAVNDPAVSEQFESNYDSGEYEAKITSLLSAAYRLDEGIPRNRQQWREAREALDSHDFYLLVMLESARTEKPVGKRYWTFMLVGFLLVAALLFLELIQRN